MLRGHERGHERCDATDPGDDGSGGDGGRNEKGDLHHKINPGGDHGGGVDQGGDGRRAFHGVRQPDVEGELGALADGAAEDAESGGSEQAAGEETRVDARFDAVEAEGFGGGPEQEDADHEPEVADAVSQESFLGRFGSAVFGIPMADQNVGADPDQFPEDEHHGEVVGINDAGHGEEEERQPGEVAGLAFIILHVAQREDVDQQTDGGDHDHHAFAEGVQLQRDVEAEGVADSNP